MKPYCQLQAVAYRIQPPSGGCVLKPKSGIIKYQIPNPAAFGRLCVETVSGELKIFKQ